MGLSTLALCLCLSWQAPADRWFGEDKFKHFFASFVVTSLGASAARATGLEAEESAWVGAGVGLGAGVWKEWLDRRTGATASLRDLAWDLGGVGAASAVMLQVR